MWIPKLGNGYRSVTSAPGPTDDPSSQELLVSGHRDHPRCRLHIRYTQTPVCNGSDSLDSVLFRVRN